MKKLTPLLFPLLIALILFQACNEGEPQASNDDGQGAVVGVALADFELIDSLTMERYKMNYLTMGDQFDSIIVVKGINFYPNTWMIIRDAEIELNKGYGQPLRPEFIRMYYGRDDEGNEGFIFVGRKKGAYLPTKEGKYLWLSVAQLIGGGKGNFGISPCPTICD